MKGLILFLFLVFTALLYLRNLSGDVFGGDVGDLVSAAYFLGVPHPPGYPLFTMLGYVFTHLSLPLPPVSKMGLISVFSSLGSLFLFYLLAYRATKNFFISFLSLSILDFSYLFWLYTEIPEVFALNNFFALLLFYLAVSFYKNKKIKYLYLLVFFSALSLTHHQTIILIFPSLFLLIQKNLKQIALNKKKLIVLFLIFLLGLLPYLYIPLAASANPIINWGEASNLENFIRLILRKDYGTFSAGKFILPPLQGRVIILKAYFLTLISSVLVPVLILSFLGMIKLFKDNKRIFFSFLTAFLLTGPIFHFYAGFPIGDNFMLGIAERFYTLSSVMLLFFLPSGFLALKNFFDAVLPQKLYSYLILAEFLILPFILLKYNLPKTDLSKTNIGNNVGYDLLASLPQKAVIFVKADIETFSSWYVSYVLGFRNDVIVVHLSGGGSRNFFKKEEEEYKKKHPDFKEDEIADGILVQIVSKRPLFSTAMLGHSLEDFIWVPRGLAYELVPKEGVPLKDSYVKQVDENLRKLNIPARDKLSLSEKNLMLASIPTIYSNVFVNTGNFIYSWYKDPGLALRFYQGGLQVDHENAEVYTGIGSMEYAAYNDCQGAENNLNKAISYNPAKKLSYQLLYTVYTGCFKDENKAKALEDKYYSLFKENILEEIIKAINKNR